VKAMQAKIANGGNLNALQNAKLDNLASDYGTSKATARRALARIVSSFKF
jgi:hypothetical protein